MRACTHTHTRPRNVQHLQLVLQVLVKDLAVGLGEEGQQVQVVVHGRQKRGELSHELLQLQQVHVRGDVQADVQLWSESLADGGRDGVLVTECAFLVGLGLPGEGDVLLDHREDRGRELDAVLAQDLVQRAVSRLWVAADEADQLEVEELEGLKEVHLHRLDVAQWISADDTTKQAAQ